MHSIVASGFFKIFAVRLLANFVVQHGDDAAGGLAACGCLGAFGFMILAFIALNIALLVWVARDAKNRDMDSAIL
jgi:hypothetical protein